ncbi:leucyl/phenylalanyl-tRNA--protein transferase [Brackiella oedipodis]|uniref:leucyl/phenylalanyl-tRNA--protein transferase n=1 Tax=Brackiella oedipodis TaxID=124225 RepID=UPI0006880072|nr:leucyl/phenylalanyl-tRNA--protein transferase [Brackiella oedipodis]
MSSEKKTFNFLERYQSLLLKTIPQLHAIHFDEALPVGLLAYSEHLHTDYLQHAYAIGAFPWSHPDQAVVLWWYPPQRMVLPVANFHISHSLKKTLKKIIQQGSQSPIQVTTDRCFHNVLRCCAQLRQEEGTWITPEFAQCYGDLYRMGLAHSIEVWQDEHLIGGLYGVCIGKMFYGESMFSIQSNASKIALAGLVSLLRDKGIDLIDCQQDTAHLRRMGAATIDAQHFFAALQARVTQSSVSWNPETITLHNLFAAT